MLALHEFMEEGHDHGHGHGHGHSSNPNSKKKAVELIAAAPLNEPDAETPQRSNSEAAALLLPHNSGSDHIHDPDHLGYAAASCHSNVPGLGERGEGLVNAKLTLVALLVHSAADGVAVGAASLVSNLALNVSVGLAILLHKLPVAFGLTALLRASGWSIKQAHRGRWIRDSEGGSPATLID